MPPSPQLAHSEKLDRLFDETDDNGNGLLEFREFQALVMNVDPSVSNEV